jgi:hypothetical protein
MYKNGSKKLIEDSGQWYVSFSVYPLEKDIEPGSLEKDTYPSTITVDCVSAVTGCNVQNILDSVHDI